MDNHGLQQRKSTATDTDYLVFTAKDYLLALPYINIIQIVDSPNCTAVPNMSPYVRGVIDFMGSPIPLIDTRTPTTPVPYLRCPAEIWVMIRAKPGDSY